MKQDTRLGEIQIAQFRITKTDEGMITNAEEASMLRRAADWLEAQGEAITVLDVTRRFSCGPNLEYDQGEIAIYWEPSP